MDRSTLGGCAMLFAFLVLGMGLWELVVDGSSEGWSTLIVGGIFLVTGFFVASWEIWRGSSGEIDPVEVEGNLAALNAVENAASAAEQPPAPPEPQDEKQRFTIHQTGEDHALDRAGEILSGDKRITSMHWETGRWYSVPDGDDLPEWFALRITCDVDDLDAFMEEISEKLQEMLPASDFNALTIAHY